MHLKAKAGQLHGSVAVQAGWLTWPCAHQSTCMLAARCGLRVFRAHSQDSFPGKLTFCKHHLAGTSVGTTHHNQEQRYHNSIQPGKELLKQGGQALWRHLR
eukprot:1141894-Pelagomonas_calceolata.AAC.7